MPSAFVLLSPDEYDGLKARITLTEERQTAMMQALQEVLREVAEQKTINASVITLLDGLAAKLAEVAGMVQDQAEAAAALEQIRSDLDDGQQELLAAINRNTPAETDPPEDPPEAT